MIPPLNTIAYAVCLVLLTACLPTSEKAENTVARASATPWWAEVESVKFAGNELYGQPCSITKISFEAGTPKEELIFEVPSRLLTYCANQEPSKNYLQLEGDYVILYVDRQTLGAGSRTNERYRSADLTSWEEYIGVTWVDGEEHEAWRTIGSQSSRADSRKKMEPAQ